MKKASDAILSCLKEKKLSQSQLAASMGEDVRHLNQQLHRQKDMKVERFTDVLDYIGYRVEVVDNDGIKKVCKEYANQILESNNPQGLFWMFEDDVYTALRNLDGVVDTKKFESKEECFQWLRQKNKGLKK